MKGYGKIRALYESILSSFNLLSTDGRDAKVYDRDDLTISQRDGQG